MKIKKVFQGAIPENKIVGTKTTSNTDAYTCNYINENFDGKSGLLLTMNGRQTIQHTPWTAFEVHLDTVTCKKNNNLRPYGYGIKCYKDMYCLVSAQCATWQAGSDCSEYDANIILKRNGVEYEMFKAYGHIIAGQLDHRSIANAFFQLKVNDELYLKVVAGGSFSSVVIGDQKASYLSVTEL